MKKFSKLNRKLREKLFNIVVFTDKDDLGFLTERINNFITDIGDNFKVKFLYKGEGVLNLDVDKGRLVIFSLIGDHYPIDIDFSPLDILKNVTFKDINEKPEKEPIILLRERKEDIDIEDFNRALRNFKKPKIFNISENTLDDNFYYIVGEKSLSIEEAIEFYNKDLRYKLEALNTGLSNNLESKKESLREEEKEIEEENRKGFLEGKELFISPEEKFKIEEGIENFSDYLKKDLEDLKEEDLKKLAPDLDIDLILLKTVYYLVIEERKEAIEEEKEPLKLSNKLREIEIKKDFLEEEKNLNNILDKEEEKGKINKNREVENINEIKTGNIIKVKEPTQVFSSDIYEVEGTKKDNGIELIINDTGEVILFPLDLLKKSKVYIISENREEFNKNS